jgi:hypothetical protein
MYRIKDEANSNNENVEENPTFGNEAKQTTVLVQCQAAVAKAKKQASLLFKRTKLDKDGVPHLYTITIFKTKTKLFHLVIRYVMWDFFLYGDEHHKLHIRNHVRSFFTFLHLSPCEQLHHGCLCR